MEQVVPEGFILNKGRGPYTTHNGPFYINASVDPWLHGTFIIDRHCNGAQIAHGGMLMSIADYCLCSVAMESKENYAATISFRSEFVAPAKVGSLVEIFTTITKETRSLAFGQGHIECEGETVFSFSGIVKKIKK